MATKNQISALAVPTTTTTAAEHQHRIIRSVSAMSDERVLKIIDEFVNIYFSKDAGLPGDCHAEAECREMHIHTMLTRIDTRYIKIIEGFVYRIYLKTW